MIDATKVLSKFVANLKYEDLSKEVIDTTKDYIIDYYASCFAGMRVNSEFNSAIEEIVFDAGSKAEASVLCSDKKLSVMDAAFMNAIYSHGADMDDGNRKAMGHVAAHVMSAVFSIAEKLGSSGKDIILAINCGYEVYNRVAAAVQPGLARRGFHSTGTAGAVACGAACAKLLGLDENGVYNAISLSAIQSSGLLIITESGQSCKPLNPANAAKVGIFSAYMAAKGIKGAEHPLESKKGWFHAMSDAWDEASITEGLGKDFTICDSYLKPYPSCRHTHCGIECAFEIRKLIIEKYGYLRSEDIDKIEVFIYRNAINIAGHVVIPKTSEETKFSIHYSLATALVKGQFGLDDLSNNNLNSDIRKIIDKIVIVEDDSMEDRRAGIRGSHVKVHLRDGTIFDHQVLIPKGDAANPMTQKEIKDKLNACAGDSLPQGSLDRLVDTVRTFEDIDKYESINMFIK